MNSARIMRVIVIVRMHRIAVRHRSELGGQPHIGADYGSVRPRKAELREVAAQQDAALGNAAGESDGNTIEHCILAQLHDVGGNVFKAR